MNRAFFPCLFLRITKLVLPAFRLGKGGLEVVGCAGCNEQLVIERKNGQGVKVMPIEML